MKRVLTNRAWDKKTNCFPLWITESQNDRYEMELRNYTKQIRKGVSKKTHPEAWAMHIKVFIQKETIDKLQNHPDRFYVFSWIVFKMRGTEVC